MRVRHVHPTASTTFLDKRRIVGLASVAMLAVPLAACGSSGRLGRPQPIARVDSLTGNSTAIALDKGFTDALTSLQLTPGTVGTAKLESGSLIFPITGGSVRVFKKGQVVPYVIGEIQHNGSGLSLSAGGTEVDLTDFNVDPGVQRVYGDVIVNGKVAATDAYLFTLNGATLKPLTTSGDTATLTGTKVEISPVAAPLLDSTFKTSAVKAGLLVGIATITVKDHAGRVTRVPASRARRHHAGGPSSITGTPTVAASPPVWEVAERVEQSRLHVLERVSTGISPSRAAVSLIWSR